MSSLGRNDDKMKLEELQQYDEDIASYCSLGGSGGNGERSDSPPPVTSGRGHHSSSGAGMEQEKRIRREIANSNERRRMQSINAGFQSLRTLLPHHEGEKLSKAAILQQTAEYIYQLEQEKTRLLSQNCHLKRLLNQHEGEASTANKKRKTDSGLVVTVSKPLCESGDEGADLITVGQSNVVSKMEVESTVGGSTNDLIDVRVQLDRERRLRMILEEQVRSLESQLYPERIREITQQVQLQYQQRDQEDDGGGAVITPMRRSDVIGGAAETVAAVANLQVVSANALQPVAHTETVIATVTSSPPPPISPSPSVGAVSRLPSILEAAIKAEPKVEVERLPSPHSASSHEDRHSQARVYLASTSRQNLETIVEAIRHLEGDNLFSDATESGVVGGAGDDSGGPGGVGSLSGGPLVDEDDSSSGPPLVGTEPQDVPLALTTSNKSSSSQSPIHQQQHLIKVNMNPYLQYHQHNQHRPGVIVVKQNT